MAKSVLRPIRIEGNVAYVPLTKGYEAVIDAADAPLVEGFNWYASVTRWGVYACRDRWIGSGRSAATYLHRVILDPPEGSFADHIDGNTLDNRRANLRPATPLQNSANSKTSSTNTSGLKGAFWNKGRGCWQAYIMLAGDRKYIGRFESAQEAHEAYCSAAKNFHGEFARTS